MHPAPFNRGVEIAEALIECSKVKNFQTNGKWCIYSNGSTRINFEREELTWKN